MQALKGEFSSVIQAHVLRSINVTLLFIPIKTYELQEK